MTKMLKLSSLSLNPRNPRTITGPRFAALVKSIKDFPRMMELRPVVVDADGMILGGNMRFRALQELGYKDVPTAWVKRAEELTPAEVRRFIVMDNEGFGQWDDDILAADFEIGELGDWGVDLERMGLADLGGDDVDAEPQIDKAAELNNAWKVKVGDLWSVGEHWLLCGDSTKREDVERVMGGGKADMIFTDPPYNVSYQDNESIESLKARNRRTDGAVVSNDAMSDEQFDAFLDSFLKCWPLRDGGAYYVCAPAGRTETQFRYALDRAYGLAIRQCIVWVKDVFVFGRQDYHWRHESILYGWREGAAHYFVDDHTQDTVWNIERPSVSKEHPTMKPVELVVKAVSNSSKIGDTVWDGFLGSGTTMVAAQNLKRKCYGIEISQDYCAVILQRMTDAFPGIEIKKIA